MQGASDGSRHRGHQGRHPDVGRDPLGHRLVDRHEGGRSCEHRCGDHSVGSEATDGKQTHEEAAVAEDEDGRIAQVGRLGARGE